ncbi:MAG: transposase family protein [Saprospirales bacterium]|nr:transposase family protein [Saprospirales bacterium]
MQYNLLEFLTDFSDPRRSQGQWHRLSVFLAMVIMAILSGHQGPEGGFTRFMKNNEEELVSIFQLKHGVPSFGTVRTLFAKCQSGKTGHKICSLDGTVLPCGAEQWLALDGKPLVLRFKTHMDRYKVLSMWSVCLLSVATWFIRWSTLKVARLMKPRR